MFIFMYACLLLAAFNYVLICVVLPKVDDHWLPSTVLLIGLFVVDETVLLWVLE